MKLRLSHSEFHSMLAVFNSMILPAVPGTVLQKLYKALLMQVYEKLYRTAIKPKQAYTISVTIPEAIAFHEFWNTYQGKTASVFETTLIMKTKNSINQKLCL